MGLLEPDYMTYPGMVTSTANSNVRRFSTFGNTGFGSANFGDTDDGLPGSSTNAGNFLNFLQPTYQRYPLPPQDTGEVVVVTDPQGRQNVMVMRGAALMRQAATAAPADTPPPTTTPPPATPGPTESAPVAMRAWASNPAFAASSDAERVITHEGPPVTFTVPPGTTAVDLSYGLVETQPVTGFSRELRHVVSTGAARIVDDNGARIDEMRLTPGSNINVVLSWSASSRSTVDAGHVRLPVYARFYAP